MKRLMPAAVALLVLVAILPPSPATKLRPFTKKGRTPRRGSILKRLTISISRLTTEAKRFALQVVV